jgi:hypothetical protein
VPSAYEEAIMPETKARESSMRQERLMVSGSQEILGGPQMAHTSAVFSRGSLPIPQASRARRRARRRRRKRSWATLWTYPLAVFLVYSTFWIGLALFSVYLPFFDGDMASPKRAEESISWHVSPEIL